MRSVKRYLDERAVLAEFPRRDSEMTAEKARKIKFAAEFQFVRDLADVPLSSGKKVRRPARKKTVEEQLRTLPRVRREFFEMSERCNISP